MGTALTAGQRAYLTTLRAALPPGFPLTVTSSGRSPEDQASAMLTKVNRYGTGSLSIYADKALIARLLALPRDAAAWAALVRSDGMRLSRHLWGGALDLRTRDLTSAQVSQLSAAVTATGGKALVEQDHLHADLPLLYTTGAYAEKAVAAAVATVKAHATAGLWAATFGVIVIGGLWFYRRYRARRQ